MAQPARLQLSETVRVETPPLPGCPCPPPSCLRKANGFEDIGAEPAAIAYVLRTVNDFSPPRAAT